MPSIVLTPPNGGKPVVVDVSANFEKLSPADQQQTVEEISQNIFPGLKPSGQSAAALQGNAPAAQVSSSPVDAFRNAAGDIVSGVGRLGGDIDNAIQNHAPAWLTKATGATNDLQSGADQAVINAGQAISGPNQYQPAPVHQLGADIAAGKPMAALNDAAGVVAGAVPYAAAAMVPGAGPVILGAAGAGNTIAAREAAKGASSPSVGDVVAGAGAGVLNAVGGGVAHGLESGTLMPALVKALGPTLAARYAGRVGLSAAAGGLLGAGNNVANTIGTGQMTPGGVGGAAVEGAGTGAMAAPAMALPGTVKSGAETLGDTITARGQGPMTDAQAASISRIVPDLARFADPANNIRPNAPIVQKIAGYSRNLAAQTLNMGDQIAAQPGMPPGVMAGVIRPLVTAAAAHNNAVPVGLLHAFNALPVDDATKATFNDAISDLDTLSQGKLLANQSGPFATIGSKIAGAGTTLALLPHSPMEAIANAAALHGLESKAGALAGGVIDRFVGTNKPVMMAQARMALKQAQAQAQASGQPIGPSSLDATQAATQQLQAANAAAAATNVQSFMQPTARALASFGPDHPVGKVALATLKANGANDMANQAIAQFNANQPVAQAKADVRNQAAADAKNEADAQRRRRADAAAALSQLAMATGKADTLAAQNQATLDAANITPQGGPGVGLTAVNAAANQLGRQANAVRAAGGEVVPVGGLQGPSESAQAGPGGGQPSMPPMPATAPGDSPRTFAEHLIARAGDEHGVALTPADLQDALTNATAAGALTPYDHDQVTANLGNRLDSGTLWNTANVILRHAVAAKAAAGVPVRGLKPGGQAGGGGGDTPPIYSPTRYANAVTTNQAHLSDVAAKADQDGDQELADLARALRVTKGVAARQALRDGAVSDRLGRGDVLGARRVTALLPDDLISSGAKE